MAPVRPGPERGPALLQRLPLIQMAQITGRTAPAGLMNCERRQGVLTAFLYFWQGSERTGGVAEVKAMEACPDTNGVS